MKIFLDTNVLFGAATLIDLASFTATPKAGRVIINFTTASELDNAGFNIYRKTAGSDWVKVNDALIPAEGTVTEGASYSLVDDDVKNRVTYEYMLEDVDLNGVATLHEPVTATPRLIHGLTK